MIFKIVSEKHLIRNEGSKRRNCACYCGRQLQRTRASCNALDEAQRSSGAGLECQREI